MNRLATVIASLALLAAPSALAQHGHGGRHGSHASSSHSSAHGSARASAPRVSARSRQHHSAAPKKATRPSTARVHTPRSTTEHAPGARDSRGRLVRSATAKEDFMRSTGHANGWRGHVVDHIVPLACGGTDSPANMQWQTTADAKAKDKVERRGCSRR